MKQYNTKIQDFNKYFARKILHVYKKDFSGFWDERSTIKNEDFENVL